jgi:hypothetical protein
MDAPWVFASRVGSGPLCREQVHRLVTALAKRAGVRPLGFHALRHYCGTRLYSQTKDLLLVQRHLRHSQIQTTTIYTHLAEGTYTAAVDALENRRVEAKRTRPDAVDGMTFDELFCMATGGGRNVAVAGLLLARASRVLAADGGLHCRRVLTDGEVGLLLGGAAGDVGPCSQNEAGRRADGGVFARGRVDFVPWHSGERRW